MAKILTKTEGWCRTLKEYKLISMFVGHAARQLISMFQETSKWGEQNHDVSGVLNTINKCARFWFMIGSNTAGSDHNVRERRPRIEKCQ